MLILEYRHAKNVVLPCCPKNSNVCINDSISRFSSQVEMRNWRSVVVVVILILCSGPCWFLRRCSFQSAIVRSLIPLKSDPIDSPLRVLPLSLDAHSYHLALHSYFRHSFPSAQLSPLPLIFPFVSLLSNRFSTSLLTH